MITLLAFSGSLRNGSFNTKALKVAAEGAIDGGARVDMVAAADMDFPLFNEDLEKAHGLPEKVLAFRARMKSADGFLIACPEYNASITPALKNAIDWASRPREGEPGLACFKGKVAGLIAASPGRLGGVRGLPETRRILSGIGVIVSATDFALAEAHTKFGADGKITDDKAAEMLHAVGREAARIAAAVSAR
jgi:Predicted flavoprotein